MTDLDYRDAQIVSLAARVRELALREGRVLSPGELKALLNESAA